MSSFTTALPNATAEPTPVFSKFTPDTMNMVWECLRAEFQQSVDVLKIHGFLYRQFDDGAKIYFARMIMKLVKERVMYCYDGNGDDCVYLGAPRHFATDAGLVINPAGSTYPVWIRRPEGVAKRQLVEEPKAKPVPAKQAKIPRPPNAYILYRKERHSMVKDMNPGITNNEISQVLGKCWNMESREVRAKYKDQAEVIKQNHREKHPGYQYKPRRPYEKRRRNTTSSGTEGDASAVATQFNFPELGGVASTST
ncbi:hypothetical protein FZEAL_411 [Fusarium zealandicum]|uniref:HMG box domain-containing protein n=1 Tax=Fusarium zealandicum TaxID=1053134 RepID=A0A8H4UVC5_9HYPO|nr:hypothetical protein FZEAL_411 [Fusarium zealandicum]